jgi:hypothetical protein
MPLPADYITGAGVTVRGVPRRLARLYRQTWTNPAALVANGIKTAFAGPNTTTFEFTPLSGFNGSLLSGNRVVLDFPRNVVITVTHGSAVVAESGVIEGLDEYGDFLSEAWSVTAGGTTKTFTGKKAFKAVTRVTVTAATDASANTNTIGTGNVLGLNVKSSVGGVASAVKELVDLAIVATGTLVAASVAATDDFRGTYLPATVPDGAHDYDVTFITEDPEGS